MSMHEHFIARVVDSVNDEEKAGRLKIRIYGLHDDTSRVPDEDLPWARCIFPVTNPVYNGTAGPTTGIMKDSTVIGFFADKQKQVPLIFGSLGGTSESQSDFPKSDRGEDVNEVLGEHLPSIGATDLKSALSKSIGSIKFDGQSITSLLSEVGAGNILGALQQGKDALGMFNNLKNSITSGGLDAVSGLVQGFASDLGSITTNIEDQVMKFTDIGTLVQKVENLTSPFEITSTLSSLEGDISGALSIPNVTDTVNHIVGNIATRTSKTAINTVEDAVTRVSGSRFVMGHVMPHLESSLNNIISQVKGS
jgi:hypothetical protein